MYLSHNTVMSYLVSHCRVYNTLCAHFTLRYCIFLYSITRFVTLNLKYDCIESLWAIRYS